MRKREEIPIMGNLLLDRAENCLTRKFGITSSYPREETKKLLHELKVHQIELEIQNEELCRAQEELEKSKAKYFDLFDQAPVGYFTLSEEGQILEANVTAAHLLGIEKQMLVQNPLSSFITPESQDTFYSHRRSVIKRGTQQSCELQLQKKNGNPFYVHLESKPIFDSQKNIKLIRTSVVDIHEKKQATDALKETAQQNQLLLNLLPHPAMLIDENRKILAANHLALTSGARVGGYWLSETKRRKKPAKKKENFEIPGKLFFSGTQNLPVQDVSILQEHLEYAFVEGLFSINGGGQTQRNLVTIVEDSHSAVTILDLNGNIKAWNKMAEKTYGYTASEALKMSVFDMVPQQLEAETHTLLDDTKAGVLIQPFETRRVAKDGCIVDIRLTVTRLIQNDKIVALATTENDITEYNRWLASIKELPQRIILAQEEERRRISQEIHSDFGQSLMALKMFVCMSASDFIKSNIQMKIFFEQVKNQLNHIIEKARDLSHELAPPSLKYIGLVEAIKKLVESMKFDKNLKIHFFHKNMGEANFEAKDIIIYRIVQEALNNIFKHAKATDVRIKAICRNSMFSLEISDNGTGFTSTKTPRSRGLGLDLMKEQAVLLHGSLNIESQEGKGTTIKIAMPVKEGRKQTWNAESS
ncbi:MAG: PAS domain S-box protein [Candidatus Riflebacteria bacterium]|nr:PAS domain S-box protein [Candidatus Riflebacteria bacterium]